MMSVVTSPSRKFNFVRHPKRSLTQSMKNRISIFTAAYFPLPFILLGILILITIGIWLSERYGPVSFFLIPIGVFVFAAHYRLTINLVDQTYYDYLWIAGFKKGQKEKFYSINGMHLTKNAYRQTFSNFVSSTTKRGIEYNGYIRLDEENVHLLSETSKSAVMKKLKSLQTMLEAPIISSTELTIDSNITDHTKD